MKFLVQAGLIKEDFTVATVIEGSEYLANNFQQDGPHHFSPNIYFLNNIIICKISNP